MIKSKHEVYKSYDSYTYLDVNIDEKMLKFIIYMIHPDKPCRWKNEESHITFK